MQLGREDRGFTAGTPWRLSCYPNTTHNYSAYVERMLRRFQCSIVMSQFGESSDPLQNLQDHANSLKSLTLDVIQQDRIRFLAEYNKDDRERTRHLPAFLHELIVEYFEEWRAPWAKPGMVALFIIKKGTGASGHTLYIFMRALTLRLIDQAASPHCFRYGGR